MSIRQILMEKISSYPTRESTETRRGRPTVKVGSRYAISAKTGIRQSVLSRFMAGKSGLRLETIEKLCDLFGLQLAETAKNAPVSGRQ